MPTKETVNVTETVRISGYGRAYIYYLLQDQKILKAQRVDRKWRIDLDSVRGLAKLRAARYRRTRKR